LMVYFSSGVVSDPVEVLFFSSAMLWLEMLRSRWQRLRVVVDRVTWQG
jgi:hypothetical protein